MVLTSLPLLLGFILCFFLIENSAINVVLLILFLIFLVVQQSQLSVVWYPMNLKQINELQNKSETNIISTIAPLTIISSNTAQKEETIKRITQFIEILDEQNFDHGVLALLDPQNYSDECNLKLENKKFAQIAFFTQSKNTKQFLNNIKIEQNSIKNKESTMSLSSINNTANQNLKQIEFTGSKDQLINNTSQQNEKISLIQVLITYQQKSINNSMVHLQETQLQFEIDCQQQQFTNNFTDNKENSPKKLSLKFKYNSKLKCFLLTIQEIEKKLTIKETENVQKITIQEIEEVQKLKIYQQSESKEEFAKDTPIQVLKSISHEIGTQINIMRHIIDSEVLKLSQISDKYKNSKDPSLQNNKIIKQIQTKEEVFQDLSNNLMLLQLVFQDFKIFSRFRIENKILLKIKKFNIYNLFSQILNLFKKKCDLKHLDLILIISQNVPQIIFADEDKIQSILTNLLSNSVKFSTNKGKIIVEVKVIHNYIQVHVIDEGIGINQEEQLILKNKLKENTLNLKVSQNSSGSGIGLLISNIFQQLLTLNNPQNLNFKSGPENKTKFMFIIEFNDYLNEQQIEYEIFHSEKQKIKFKKVSSLQIKSQKQIQSYLNIQDDLMDVSNSKISVEHQSSQNSEDLNKFEEFQLYNSFKFCFKEQQFKLCQSKYQQLITKSVIPSSSVFNQQKYQQSLNSSQNSEFSKEAEEFYYKYPSLYNIIENININKVPQFVESALKNERILLVDDEPSNIFYVKSVLENFGFKYLIDTAQNGQEALDKLISQYSFKNISNQNKGVIYKVIIMDINMPILNGFQSCEKIFQLFESNQYPIKPYILAYSAYSEDQEIQFQCQQIGMSEFICKPCSLNVLVPLIRSYYSKKTRFESQSLSQSEE